MLINELPDECLLAIFNYMSDLDDLINCYKVCVKWSHLIPERTKKIKYLIDSGNYHHSFDCVYNRRSKPIDGTCLGPLFPNLIFADFSYHLVKRSKRNDIVAFVRNLKSLKGLIDGFHGQIAKYCDQLEMISIDCIESSIRSNGANIKQLSLFNLTLDDFKRDAHYFPNLEKLNIYKRRADPDSYYDGPALEKLKIFELSLSSSIGLEDYYGFQFMDSCPNLQSAHIVLDSDRLFVDESVKHNSLQDLVITSYYGHLFEWNDLKRLLMKYQNLKHLALRSFLSLKNEHVEQLVHILPNLVLLDVIGCRDVTQTAADYVQDYCKRYGRSIKFYFNQNYHEIQSDWPHLSTKHELISQGFDFMKHCFLKNFRDLPVFLIPIGY